MVSNFCEFSPATANEIVYRINSSSSSAYEVFKEFISLIPNPTVIDDGVKKDFYPLDYLSVSGTRTHFENMPDAMEEVFDSQEKQNAINSQKHSLVNALNNFEKRLLKRDCN